MTNHTSTTQRKNKQTKVMNSTEFRSVIDREIANTFAKWLPRSFDVDEVFAELVGEMASFIDRGGKRMRPYLCYLGYIGSGGKDIDQIIKVAVSQELYHNAWLIHDDIIDRDTTRYGGPNITGAYLSKLKQLSVDDSQHLAEAAALIAGNVNMAFAVDSILSSDFPDELKVSAVKLQQELIVALAGGELLDVMLPTLECKDLTKDRLLALSRYKTATYSFQGPIQIGAILAGASQDEVDSIAPFAIDAGIAFQLSDDVLGIFGDDYETGKSNLSDIREGKRTILVLETLERAKQNDTKIMLNILGNHVATTEDLNTVREIMMKSGGFDATTQLVNQYIDSALMALRSTSLSEDVRKTLHDIVTGLIGRKV